MYTAFAELFANPHCLCSSLLNDALPPLNPTSPLQNPAPQHHTLPLLDCASPLLNATSPRFAFATQSSLFYALAKPYHMKLYANSLCLCFTRLESTTPLPYRARPCLHPAQQYSAMPRRHRTQPRFAFAAHNGAQMCSALANINR